MELKKILSIRCLVKQAPDFYLSSLKGVSVMLSQFWYLYGNWNRFFFFFSAPTKFDLIKCYLLPIIV